MSSASESSTTGARPQPLCLYTLDPEFGPLELLVIMLRLYRTLGRSCAAAATASVKLTRGFKCRCRSGQGELACASARKLVYLTSYAKLDRRDAALATVDTQAVARNLQIE